MLEKYINKKVFIEFIDSKHSSVRAKVLCIDNMFMEIEIESGNSFVVKNININSIFSIREL